MEISLRTLTLTPALMAPKFYKTRLQDKNVEGNRNRTLFNFCGW